MREIVTAQTVVASQANRPTASDNLNRPAHVTASDESVQSNRLADDGSPTISDGQDSVFRFRRVYLPLSRILERSGKPHRYLPMDLDEFEERVRQIAKTIDTQPEMGAQILAAKYEAHLDERNQWVGHGQWTVKHSASTPVMLRVSPCGLALSNPHWISLDHAERARASLGMAPRGNVALRVERSGELQFEWSLRPTTDETQDSSFEFALPNAPASEMVLHAPADRVLIAEGATPLVNENTNETSRAWRIRLRGDRALKVTLLAPGRTTAQKSLNVLRPVVEYDMKPSGMQVTADWRLDVLGEPLRQLVVDLDSDLELVQVQHAGQELRVSKADSQDGRQRVTIHLAQPATGANQLLRLIAVAPLKLEVGWRLPRITVTNVVPQEAKATLVVAAPLRLTNLMLEDCRQVSRERSASPNTETIELECLSDRFRIDVGLSAGIDKLRYTSASIVDAQPNEARFRHICDISCLEGERFQLSAEISPNWIVDSVATSPADMLTDWEVQRSGASPGRLIVHLSRPLNADRSLRLIVTAQRRRAPLRDILDASDFLVLKYQDIKPARRLAVIHTDTAHRLDVQPGYATTRLDLDRLDPDDAALLGDDQQGFGFVLDDRADDLEIRLVPETPDFSADIDVQATISDEALQEAYSIACNPESNKVDQVLIHFSSAREVEPEWTLDTGATISSAQRLDADEQRRLGLSGSAETWRLRFRTPVDQRFVVRAQRSSPLGDHLSLSLASLPEATSQRGTVTVQSQSDVPFALHHHRLRAIPPALREFGSDGRVLGSFAFDPLDEAQRDSALELVRQTKQRLPAWIWNCTGNTWLSIAGPIRHSALMSIETAGFASIQLQMAEVVGEPRVLIDGSNESRVTFDSKHSRLTVPLPFQRRDCSVLVEWVTPSVQPGSLMNLAIQSPQADVPILARRWTLWLPPGYDLLNSPPQWRLAGEHNVSWHERLFGGLGRARDQDTFEPWLAHDWAALGRRLSGSTGRLDTAQAFVAQLGASDLTRSWGARIAEAWSAAGAAADQPLLIDFTALDRLGIQASATQQRESSVLATGSVDHDLIVLAHHSVSILTSRQRAAEVLDSSIASSSDRAFFLPDLLAEQILEGNKLMPFGELIALEAWLASPNFGAATRSTGADDLDLRVTRWTPHCVELPDSQALQLVIIRRPFVAALGYAAILIGAAVAWLCVRRPPLFRLAMLGIAAIIALVVPETWIPLGSGVFLGLAFGFVSQWIAGHVLKKTESTAAIVPGFVPTRAIPATALCIASVLATQLSAVEQLPTGIANTPIFDILFPTDIQTEPRGKRVYIPEPFYKELISATPRSKINDGQWLITQARYECPRAENRGTNGSVWIARYGLDAFGSARVRLPLGRRGAHLVPQGATLDEKPLQFELDEVNGEMVFDVPKAGSYKLRVEFVPISPREGVPLIDFSIPAIPDSRLLLAPLPGITRPVVNGYGMIASPTDGNGLICDLGPADKITIRNAEASQMPQSAEFESTEMFWLNAGPGSLTLQGRWELKMGRGTVRSLVLELDPAAHLLPPDDASVISRVRQMNDGKHVQIEFREPVDDSIVFDLSFVLEPPAAPGRINWPLIGLLGAKQTRRILAASATPQVVLQTFPIPGAKTLSPTEFALLWPTASTRPKWIVEVPSTSGGWEIQIGPRPSTILATYQAIAAARREKTDLHWLADIQIGGEPALELKIRAPKSLAVEDVVISDAAGRRPSRWTQNRSGDISLVLESPMVGEAQVRLSGSVTLDSDGKVAVPSLALFDAVTQQETIFVTRRSNTSVALTNTAGLQQLPLDDSKSRYSDFARQLALTDAGRGDRLVAALSGNERTAPLELRVTSNRPQTETVQVMAVERSEAGWTATLDSEITTSGGTHDELRFGLPESWAGPFSIEPSMPSEVLNLPIDARVLVLHPPAPITGTTRLRIHGPLKTDGGQPLRVPEVRLDGAKSSRDFLVLPTQYNLQQLAWDTRGLIEESLPETFEQSTARPSFKTYLRAAPRATAELKSIEKLAENAHVRVADLGLAWHADGSCYGAASFDLDPAGAETCLLALPQNFELVHLAIDGMSQPQQPIANLRWRVSLARARLPLRIDVVYRGRLPDNPRDVPQEALAPWLVGLPVEKTLWTISGPYWAGLPTIDAHQSLSAAGAEIARLESTTSLIATAASTIVEQSTDDVLRWYRPWLDRWLQSRDAAKRLAALSVPYGDAPDVTDPITREESKQMRLARQIEAWPAIEPVWNQTATPDSMLRSWQRSLGRSHGNAYSVLAGAAIAPALEYPRAYAGDWATRVGQAAIACVVVLLIGWAIRATRLPEALNRWPQAAVIAIGLFWWLWLSPSAFGWIIVALGAFGPRIDRAIGVLMRRFRPARATAR